MIPAFLVDGLTEQKFIQAICPTSPVRLIGLNGNSVSSAAMAKRISSLIRIWKGRYYPIIVVVDREDRVDSCSDFCIALYNLIKSEVNDEEIIVGISDRMIENWMIADQKVWPQNKLKDNVDGFSGVSIIKGYMPKYNKTAIGPDLLRRSRASEIAKKSRSFCDFYEKVSHLNCYWLQQ